MAEWLNKADVVDAYGSDSLPLDDAGAENDQYIDRSIVSSRMLIEGYLRKANLIPLDSAGAEIDLQTQSPSTVLFLREINLSIVNYYMSDGVNSMTEEIRKRYEDAIKLLEDIVKGKISPPIDFSLDDQVSKSGTRNITLTRA